MKLLCRLVVWWRLPGNTRDWTTSLLAALSSCLVLAMTPPVRANELHLDRAEFRWLAGGPAVPVALPDTWVDRGITGLGPMAPPAQYRLSFNLPEVPPHALALRFLRVCSQHQVWLNGVLLQDRTSGFEKTVRRPWNLVLDLPSSLLKPGQNKLDLNVLCGLRSGLSDAWIGPSNQVNADQASLVRKEVTFPVALNLAAVGVSLFLMWLWVRHRANRALGLFAIFCLLHSARTSMALMDVLILAQGPADGWLVSGDVLSVGLFCEFVLAYTGRPARRFRASLWTCCAALLILGVVEAFTGGVLWARKLGYPLLALWSTFALGWLWAHRPRPPESPWWAELGVPVSISLMCLAWGHDGIYQQGHLSIMDRYWMPLALPVALLAYAAGFLSQVAAALRRVEDINLVLEHQVAERTVALERAHAEQARFLAAASHDLRQPVAAVGLWISVLKEHVVGSGPMSIVAKVESALSGLEQLLNGLLDLSRLKSGFLKADLQPVPLQAVFDRIRDHEAPVAARKGLALRMRPSALVAHADPLLLEQLLRNLVANATRYTAKGGVLLSARVRDTDVLLQVFDTGPGIEPSKQAAVFEAFVSMPTANLPTSDRMSSLGLGLAIARRCAELMGADLTLQSRLGRGTCFALRLPLHAAVRRPPPMASVDRVDLTGLTVLVLDDDMEVRGALTELLQTWGAHVVALATMSDLAGHLAKADATVPSLFITDHVLPDGDSGQSITLMAARWQDVPSLVITGHAEPRISQAAWLRKPFRPSVLAAAMSQLLQAS